MDVKDLLANGQSTVPNVILKYYRTLGLTEKELVMYLMLLMEQQERRKPLLEKLSKMMQISIEETYSLLSQLEHKGWIRLYSKPTPNGKIDDFYDLTPVYHKIDQVLLQQKRVEHEKNGKTNIRSLLKLLEKEIARPLSPIEIEKVDQWVIQDEYDPEMIRLAFREAIYHNVRAPFSYADRILIRWRNAHIKNAHDASADLERNRKHKEEHIVEQAAQQNVMQVPLFDDWS